MRAHIPQNISDNGGLLGGLVKTRNAIEAGTFLALLYIISKLLSLFISIKIVLVIFITIALPVTAILLIGINGRSVTEVLLISIKYKAGKGIWTLRKPEAIKGRKTT